MTEVVIGPAPLSRKSLTRKHYIGLTLLGVFLTVAILGVLNGPWVTAELKYRFSHHTRTVNVLAASTAAPGTPSPVVTPKPDPSAPSEIYIPAIDVKAPIVFEPTRVEWKVQLALRNGVVHYGDTAVPGQNGNVAIFGHSSGQAWAPGDYKWIFTLLDKLRPGDQIKISYQGLSYIYEVTDSTVVAPTDLDVIAQTSKPTLTLITCTPVGTSTNRLVVHAKQIEPATNN
jgi:LPXTG-site transpeptidase (sortase) family protein